MFLGARGTAQRDRPPDRRPATQGAQTKTTHWETGPVNKSGTRPSPGQRSRSVFPAPFRSEAPVAILSRSERSRSRSWGLAWCGPSSCHRSKPGAARKGLLRPDPLSVEFGRRCRLKDAARRLSPVAWRPSLTGTTDRSAARDRDGAGKTGQPDVRPSSPSTGPVCWWGTRLR